MLSRATWAKDFYEGNIVIYTGIESWIRKSRIWMKKFMVERMGCKPEDIIFHKMWCEWSMFAKIGEQWWYFSSGDCRFRFNKSMLVRKASGPKDYRGSSNQFVFYDSPDFTKELEDVLRTGHTQRSFYSM
jgi:hypothetical protein